MITLFALRRAFEGDAAVAQRNGESREFDRGPVGTLKRLVRRRRVDPSWKREWYARGERVTVDASPFLGG